MKPLLPFFATIALLCVSCAAADPVIPADFDGAIRAVRAAYKAEVWNPDSTAIRKVEHFPDSPRLFLIVTFTSGPKSYIYEDVPASMVKAWKSSPSAGRWYHANLRGNQVYFFQP